MNEVALVSFFQHKVTPSLHPTFAILPSLKGCHCPELILEGEGATVYLLESEASISLFGILLHGKFCLFSPIDHVIIYLHKLWAHGNLFYTWVIVQNDFIPFLKLFCLWSLRFFQLVLACVCVSVCILYFLTSWLIIKYSGFTLYISCPSSRLSLFFRELWFLWMKNEIRNQDLSTRQLVTPQV